MGITHCLDSPYIIVNSLSVERYRFSFCGRRTDRSACRPNGCVEIGGRNYGCFAIAFGTVECDGSESLSVCVTVDNSPTADNLVLDIYCGRDTIVCGPLGSAVLTDIYVRDVVEDEDGGLLTIQLVAESFRLR